MARYDSTFLEHMAPAARSRAIVANLGQPRGS
jgi:hypothetical protein